MTSRRWLTWCGPVLAFALMSISANAEEGFPVRPIRIVVPFPPGASTDLISRAVAEEAGKRLGQPIIVENRPGGGTVVGTLAVKTAAADGYTLMFQTAGFVANRYAFKKPGYELSDFSPVVGLAETAYVLLVTSQLPVKSLGELVAHAKANPGKLNYGALGRAAGPFLLSTRLAEVAGLDWADISYKGTTEAAQAVMSGDIQAYFSTQAYASTQMESDKLRLLAVTSEKRVDFLPNVPTFKELGYPQLTEKTWYALFARSETPKPILDKLRSVFAETMKSPPIQIQLRNNGLSPFEIAIETFPAKLEADYARFVEEAKRLNITPQ